MKEEKHKKPAPTKEPGKKDPRKPKSGFMKAWHDYSVTLVRSITDLRFYREVRHRRPARAIGYFAILLILFWVIPFAMVFFGGIRQGLDAAIRNLREEVPQNAEFTLKDGTLTNNLEAPLVIREGEFTVIVNTATSTKELAEDEIGMVVNSDAIVQQEASDRRQIIGYSDFPEFSVTRAEVDENIDRYAKWVILAAATIAIPFFFLAVGFGYGVYLLFHALLVWLFLKAFKRPVRYAQAFSVATYAVTMPLIVKAVFSWSGISIGAVPTYLYWILLGFIIYDFVKGGRNERQEKAAAEDGPRESDGGSA